jgi:hypothetical protein
MKNIKNFKEYKTKKSYLVYTLHDSSSDASPILAKNYDQAVDHVHDYFLSYDFYLKDGRPYDDGNESEDDPEEGFSVFSQVELYNGKVARFTHSDGDGPMAWISFE